MNSLESLPVPKGPEATPTARLPATEGAAGASASGWLSVGEGARAYHARMGTLCALTLVLFSALVFWRLGHYALWDDEANTALFAENVWRTGDTSAVFGKNLLAYRSGAELEGMKNRYVPPLAYYVAAPSVGLLGRSEFSARLPFALFGVAGVALILWWLWRERAPLALNLLVAVGLVLNVPLLLYVRQARYYSLAFFFSVLVAYLYLRWSGRRRGGLFLALAASALFAANYVVALALQACLVMDYLVWRRGEGRLAWPTLAWWALPQGLLCGGIFWVYCPLGKRVVEYQSQSWVLDRVTILWWSIRDLGVNEMVAAIPLLLGAVFARRLRDAWLSRGSMAFAVYLVVYALASPQPVSRVFEADVRFLLPLIPLGIVLTARLLWHLANRRGLLSGALALLLFGTNAVSAQPFFLAGTRDGIPSFLWSSRPAAPRSTFLSYVGELAEARLTPLRATSEWLKENVRPGESVLVAPLFSTYPLMYHAPHVVYAWQIEPRYQDALPPQDAIHYQFREMPDVVVAFGGDVLTVVMATLEAQGVPRGVRYTVIGRLDIFHEELTRPEIAWRSFEPVVDFDPAKSGVFLLRKVPR